jgi:hypothetical protein
MLQLVQRDDNEIVEAKARLIAAVPDDCDGFAIVWFSRKRDQDGTINASCNYHVRNTMDAFGLPDLARLYLSRCLIEE